MGIDKSGVDKALDGKDWVAVDCRDDQIICRILRVRINVRGPERDRVGLANVRRDHLGDAVVSIVNLSQPQGIAPAVGRIRDEVPNRVAAVPGVRVPGHASRQRSIVGRGHEISDVGALLEAAVLDQVGAASGGCRGGGGGGGEGA